MPPDDARHRLAAIRRPARSPRRLALVVVWLALGGCNVAEPCRPGTLLLALRLLGPSTMATALQVSVVVGGSTLRAGSVPYGGQPAFNLEIDFAHGYPKDETAVVTVTAVQGATVLGSASTTTQLAQSCGHATLSLGSGAPDGGVDLAPASCGAQCALLALSPAVARSGDVVTLEGNFGGAVSVQFPGSAVAVAATVLGSQRASVVVPADASAGPLSITTTGSSGAVGALLFRRAPFTLGLGRFDTSFTQAGSARAPSALTTGRSAATLVNTGTHLYAIGGTDGGGNVLASVEVALVDGDDSIATFTPLARGLTAARSSHVTVVAGHDVYVLGGCLSATSCPTSVEHATIDASGHLGDFALLAGVHMTTPRCDASALVVGSSLYVIGGATYCGGGSVELASVERATINPDGTLSAFSLDGDSALTSGRAQHASAIVGDSLYVIGGIVAGQFSPTIERAAIGADGSLAPFSTHSSALVSTRSALTAQRFGQSLCVFGGAFIGGLGLPVGQDSTECATVASDGTLAPFATSEFHLRQAVYAQSTTIVGSTLYVVGGLQPGAAGTVSYVQHASLDTSGSRAVPATTTTTLAARSGHRDVVVGPWLYALGGKRYGATGSASPACTGGKCIVAAGVAQTLLAPDGSVAAAPAQSAASLATVRADFGAAVIGNSVYVLGGANATALATTVERATFDGDGVLAPFATVPGVALVDPRGGFTTSVVCSGASPPVCALYVAGGYDATGILTTVERAPIASDGSLGTFATVAGVTLAARRRYPSSLVSGSHLYAIGGCQDAGAALASVEQATIGSDGTLATFAVVPGVTLAKARCGQTNLVIGPSLHVVGGLAGSAPLSGIESAAINGDGSLGSFSAASDALTAARALSSGAVLGNRFWIMGGDTSASATLGSFESGALQ